MRLLILAVLGMGVASAPVAMASEPVVDAVAPSTGTNGLMCQSVDTLRACLLGGGFFVQERDPGGSGVRQAVPDNRADGTCRYFNDGECDEVSFGGSMVCDDGSDANDCAVAYQGPNDDCAVVYGGELQFDEHGVVYDASMGNNGSCDEVFIGDYRYQCARGTDATDCALLGEFYHRDNTCLTSYDGICDEPGGTGRCDDGSDTADCVGRARLPAHPDHYFGRDDRYIPDSTTYPWSAVGFLAPGCSGTLVHRNIVLTAAHCVIDDDDRINVPSFFAAGFAGDTEVARSPAVRVVVSPDYIHQNDAVGRGRHDWAFVILQDDIGDIAGTVPVHVITPDDEAAVMREGLLVQQAGYSWDTRRRISANYGCRVVEFLQDGGVLHQCDTTPGDSGSPFLIDVDGELHVFAVESRALYYSDPTLYPFPSGSMAADSRVFADALAQEIKREETQEPGTDVTPSR